MAEELLRGLEERFCSRILPVFARRTPAVSALLPDLSLHGLAEGDCDLALRGLLGEDAPPSASTVARLKDRWQAQWEAWRQRRLEDVEVVSLGVDGVSVKAGLEREKAARLVVVAGLSDGRQAVLAVTPGQRESTESWADVLRDLRSRGMHGPKLVIGDGSSRVPSTPRPKPMLSAIAYAPTRAEAEQLRGQFEAWCRRQGYGEAAATLGRP